MLRRHLLTVLFAPDRWGERNRPRCPVCRAELPADHPDYMPVVAPGGEPVALPAVRDCFCHECGARFVVSA